MGFNPRPLLLTGESRAARNLSAQGDEFQSTPVIANGRIAHYRGESEGWCRVSIHARYC